MTSQENSSPVPDIHAPYTAYVMDISYFSGKFESYLRYKNVPYQRISVNHNQLHNLFVTTGAMKVPALHTAEGLWLKDTTPMIEWFEQRYTENPVIPPDPAMAFVGWLLEDFADEWLWRPAMWWRWEPKVTRLALGRRIAVEVLAGFPAPKWILMHYFAWRQRRTWLWGDGMNRQNNHQVRDIYTQHLSALQQIFQRQPYLLGSHPSIADFGYFGPFFRHFNNDPDPAEVMRLQGPAVYEWCARLWNQQASTLPPTQEWIWPDAPEFTHIWKDICQVYLPYLHQNAVAWKHRQSRFDIEAEGYQFKRTVTTHYRVWCRQQLQRKWQALPPEAQSRVNDLLDSMGGLSALMQDGEIDAKLDQELLTLPFPARPPKPWWQRARAWAFGTARNTP